MTRNPTPPADPDARLPVIDWNTLTVEMEHPWPRWSVSTDMGLRRGVIERIEGGVLAHPSRNRHVVMPGVGDTVREAINDLLDKSGQWV